ncbi:hypothetical protein D3C85_1224610 [compost metagenome]
MSRFKRYAPRQCAGFFRIGLVEVFLDSRDHQDDELLQAGRLAAAHIALYFHTRLLDEPDCYLLQDFIDAVEMGVNGRSGDGCMIRNHRDRNIGRFVRARDLELADHASLSLPAVRSEALQMR